MYALNESWTASSTGEVGGWSEVCTGNEGRVCVGDEVDYRFSWAEPNEGADFQPSVR